MEDDVIKMPCTADEPTHFLVWQWDETLPVCLGLMLGIMFGSPIIGMIIGYAFKGKYIKLRDGKPRGYFFHRIREAGFSFEKNDKPSSMPPALIDKFHS